MDVTRESAQATVVGFCGLAVDGAAGVRAPVFAHPEGFYFIGDPDAPVPGDSRWTRADLEELDRRGTICLISRAWPRQRGGVILYAHPSFVLPGEGRFDLHESLLGFDLEPKIGCHVRYLARDEALATMRQWAERLLDDARDHLRPVRPHGDWERALDSAERARLVAPPPDLADLRVEAFVIIGAAWKALGKDFDDVLWDAESERDADLLRQLKMRAPVRAEFLKSMQGTGRLQREGGAARGSRERPVLRVGGRSSSGAVQQNQA